MRQIHSEPMLGHRRSRQTPTIRLRPARPLRVVGSLVLWLLSTTGDCWGASIHVAVASNFAPAMEDIAQLFQQETGHRVVLSSASSGKLAAQIQHGAPYDIFLSADQAKPIALERAGHAVSGTRFTYALGALVLWSANSEFAGREQARLTQGQYRKLAIANPRLAPYGQAALETLRALGLAETSRPHWVTGENIGQTYQFVATGNADLGFVALSQLLSAESAPTETLPGWQVPTALHQPIRQDAVLLSSTQDLELAGSLLTFLASDRAREIIHAYGYRTE